MSKNLLLLATAALSLSGFVVSPLRADEADRKTVIAANERISVQGTVLEPGEYVFKLLDSTNDPDVVQVYDRDQKHLITTVIAIPAYRPDPPDHTLLTFYEGAGSQPAGLRTWFYPGDNFGFEFRDVGGNQ